MMITPMLASDAEAVARLAGQLGYPSDAATIAGRLAALSADPGHALFVARETPDGPAIGWIHVYAHHSLASDSRAEVTGLVVEESYRDKGIGSRLLAAAENWTRARGLQLLRFSSNIKREEAHRLYLRLGYGILKTSHMFAKEIPS